MAERREVAAAKLLVAAREAKGEPVEPWIYDLSMEVPDGRPAFAPQPSAKSAGVTNAAPDGDPETIPSLPADATGTDIWKAAARMSAAVLNSRAFGAKLASTMSQSDSSSDVHFVGDTPGAILPYSPNGSPYTLYVSSSLIPVDHLNVHAISNIEGVGERADGSGPDDVGMFYPTRDGDGEIHWSRDV